VTAIAPAANRPERNFGGDKKFSPVRRIAARARIWQPPMAAGSRRRGSRPIQKPWQKREDRGERDSVRPRRRPNFDKPRFDKPRYDKPREDRPCRATARFRERPKFDRPGKIAATVPNFDRPRQRPEGRTDWQEHRAASRAKIAAPRKRGRQPDFCQGVRRSAPWRVRERSPSSTSARQRPPPRKGKIRRAYRQGGVAGWPCLRRDAQEWITQGRVSVNGRVINSPALDVTAKRRQSPSMVNPCRARTHPAVDVSQAAWVMTTHADPEGRPRCSTICREGLPRLISIGRLDFNTRGPAAADQ